MYDAIDAILMITLIVETHKDKKQVKKLLLKLLKKVTPEVKRAIVDDVLDSVSYKDAIYDHVFNFISLEQAANEILSYGCVGMVTYEGIAYPIQLVPSSEYEKRWMIVNEERTCYLAAENLAAQLQLDEIECTVAYFKNKGFSGIAHKIKYNTKRKNTLVYDNSTRLEVTKAA